MTSLGKLSTICILAVCFVLCGTSLAAAGTQSGAVFALHAQDHNSKTDPCDRINEYYALGSTCTDFNTSCELTRPYDLYFVVANADPGAGVAFASFGITYNHGETGDSTKNDLSGVDVYSWTPCTSWTPVPFPPETSPDTFPASGSGLRIYWDPETDCQISAPSYHGVETVIGCLYVFAYSQDQFFVAENTHAPDGPELLVGDCSGEWSTLRIGHLGMYLPWVSFSPEGTQIGNNPCFYVPVRRTTWSRLKTRYGETKRAAP